MGRGKRLGVRPLPHVGRARGSGCAESLFSNFERRGGGAGDVEGSAHARPARVPSPVGPAT